MHCGMCLPTCPTYDATKLERNSPRGRIAVMRAIADDRLEPTQAFADEMYFCLGCLACMTACPAGVNYAELFEHARAEAEQSRSEEHTSELQSRLHLVCRLLLEKKKKKKKKKNNNKTNKKKNKKNEKNVKKNI